MKLFGVQHSARAARRRKGLPPFDNYHADAVHFDGTAFMSRGAALTGMSGNYSQCIISHWFKQDNAQGTIGFSRDGGLFSHGVKGNGNSPAASVNFYDADFNGDTVDCNVAGSTDVWHHVLIAYDANNHAGCKGFFDGVDVTSAGFFNTGSATLTGETNYFMMDTNGIGGTVADLAQYYIAFGQWIDLSNPLNVAKYIAGGKPVDLGADGSTPTGTAPTVFFDGDATEFPTNKGTGGAFTLTGSLTNASTSPSD
jgi:hypothetical protein